MAPKKQKAPVRKGGKKKQKFGKSHLFSMLGMFAALVFLPTTIILFIGMMPTLAAILVSKMKRRTRAITVGAMNLAGTSPFLFELWMRGNDFAKAFEIVTDAKAIIVMYSAAAIGYIIDWAMTGLVAGFLLQRGKGRVKAIEERQRELKERWGKEVSGEHAMDQYGFAIDAEKEE